MAMVPDTLHYYVSPTSFLPPLAQLSSQSTQEIASALANIRTLYWPPKPSQLRFPRKLTMLPKRILDESVPDSGYASAEDDDDASVTTDDYGDKDSLEILRADHFEREFAIKWTTGFVSRSSPWIEHNDTPTRTDLLEEATTLLALFSGDDIDTVEDAVEHTIVRKFKFATKGGNGTVEVEMHDAPMLENDHTSVGLQSWGSCIRLGEKIAASQEAFFTVSETHGRHPLRVLELGAGTGLLSILTAKLLDEQKPIIVATDYHPDVLENLDRNVRANFPSPSFSCTTSPVAVSSLDWEAPSYAAPLDAPFDIILAADVIYHPLHARWLRGCIKKLLAPHGVCWMIIAVRKVGRHEGLDGSVAEVFDGSGGLGILDMEEAGKEEGVGRADESGYKLFKIGWL